MRGSGFAPPERITAPHASVRVYYANIVQKVFALSYRILIDLEGREARQDL